MQIEDVLQFWFGADPEDAVTRGRVSALWWGGSAQLDAEIGLRFGALRERAIAGELAPWEQTARGRLALIILVDQFSRNIHRGRAEAFAQDHLARAWCLGGVELGQDRLLRPVERMFFYLPLEHSESLDDQARSVALCEALEAQAGAAEKDDVEGCADYARRHRDIIRRFGRFPHRNAVLGRASTAAELEFLQQPGSSF